MSSSAPVPATWAGARTAAEIDPVLVLVGTGRRSGDRVDDARSRPVRTGRTRSLADRRPCSAPRPLDGRRARARSSPTTVTTAPPAGRRRRPDHSPRPRPASSDRRTPVAPAPRPARRTRPSAHGMTPSATRHRRARSSAWPRVAAPSRAVARVALAGRRRRSTAGSAGPPGPPPPAGTYRLPLAGSADVARDFEPPPRALGGRAPRGRPARRRSAREVVSPVAGVVTFAGHRRAVGRS